MCFLKKLYASVAANQFISLPANPNLHAFADILVLTHPFHHTPAA